MVAWYSKAESLLREGAVQIFSVARVVNVHAGVGSAGSDREAVHTVVGLGPPAVEDRKIEAAIQHDLLTAGAGSFQRPARIVQPDIDALDQMAADIDVVVFDEDEPARRSRRSRINSAIFCSTCLPGSSCGWALPAKMNCTGRFGSLTIAASFSISRKNQIGPLVCCEPSGKADRQCIRVSTAAEPSQISGDSPRRGLLDGAAPDEFQQP